MMPNKMKFKYTKIISINICEDKEKLRKTLKCVEYISVLLEQ